MPNERDQLIKLVTASQAALMRSENRLVNEVLADYDQVRRELMADFMNRFSQLPDDPTQAQIRALANDQTLIAAIDRRMVELNGILNQSIDPAVTQIANTAFANAAQEVAIIAGSLGVASFVFDVDPLLEIVVKAAIDQIPLEVETFRALLISELRQGLAAGESMQTISRRLFQATPVDGRPSVFSRGQVSAELMTRRAVIQSNNNSKSIYLDQAGEQVPIQKQAIASINARTTQTCLRVHGQIRDLDQPFELTGEPRFEREMQQPPFHWNCRTEIVAYNQSFEEGSALSTANMRKQAIDQEAANRTAAVNK